VTQAQESEDCGSTDNKKAQKLFEKGTDKKNDKGDRIRYLLDAIEADPDYVAPRWAVSYITIRDALRRGKTYYKVADDLEKVVTECPGYHSSPFYYLASIRYAQENYAAAADLYKQFLDFQSDDDSKFDRKYDELLADAKGAYKRSKFFAEQYASPKPYDPVAVAPISTSQSDEYLPFISPDNELLLFTRRDIVKQNPRMSSVQSDRVDFTERFSFAEQVGERFTSKGQPFPSPFNGKTDYNYGGACLSIDNKELYLTICQPTSTGYTNCDIVYTEKTYGYNEQTGKEEWYWKPLENLGPAINTPDGWEAQPTVSLDGKMLLFASLREGSQGIDIYRSVRKSNGEWGPAENIGAPINTPDHEKTPFFHSDKRTLYFASKGHLNFGGYDVFYAKFTEDGTFTEPQNLGYPINTPSDEHGYVVSTDGKRVFFASKQLKGTDKINIYSFELYPEARPEKVIVLKGDVRDKQGNVPKDATVELRNTANNRVEKFNVDRIEGRYTAIVTVEDSGDFVVNIKGRDVAFNTYQVSGSGESTYQELDMAVEKVEVGKPYRMENVQFGVNSAELTEASRSILDAFADYLRENASIRISIEGHTDNVGDPNVNLTLSTERAFSVLAYLQERGIPNERLQFKGWGSQKPLASNSTPDGRAKNRRTEFIILSK